jgi:hypothetical protein
MAMRGGLALVGWILLATSPDAEAATPDVQVAARCERAVAPGRVRCDVDASVGNGAALKWGDVIVVRAPDFVVPLKGRIGPSDATAHGDDAWRWSFAVVARQKGEGDLALRVRLVVCEGTTCAPQAIDATARVAVGER